MLKAAVLLTAILLCSPCIAGEGGTVTVTPKPSDELFANPYMGWETFQTAAKEDPGYGVLPSSVLYARYYWDAFEPSPAVYDWKVLDDAIASAAQGGQTLAFRIMTCGTERRGDYSPRWLIDLGGRIHKYRREKAGREQWTPDFNDPIFLEKHLAFIRALGKRYNGRPEIALVDIGSVGLWGEWHMSGTDVPMPTAENADKIIDAYAAAFPDTPLVMQLDNIEGMKHARTLGIGWRVDCWGDMGGFSKTWCHMRTVYPQALKETQSQDSWKKSPVALETCWDMRRWDKERWDLETILKWALGCHVSFINNKSEPVPAEYIPKVKAFLLKVGYRFELRSATYPKAVERANTLDVHLAWSNVGVAPCYIDFHPALALADASGKVVWSTSLSVYSTRDWLPGDIATDAKVALPESIAAGKYTLLVAVADRDAKRAVRLAIEGRRDDGWYPLGPIEVK
jgi:hypothetical protein